MLEGEHLSHYNIYEDLGLDRSLDSATIAKILDDRLTATPTDDLAEQDRLKTARKLFGNDARRAAYDQSLDDPTGPALTIGRFRAYADGILPDSPKLQGAGDRKSTRLNSSHVSISYAVFCLKKK